MLARPISRRLVTTTRTQPLKSNRLSEPKGNVYRKEMLRKNSLLARKKTKERGFDKSHDVQIEKKKNANICPRYRMCRYELFAEQSSSAPFCICTSWLPLVTPLALILPQLRGGTAVPLDVTSEGTTLYGFTVRR